MRYDKSKFTDCEIKAIKKVAKSFCEFLNVDFKDVCSKKRTRELVDARVMITNYQFNNIEVNYYNEKTYALSCWLFDRDHTSGYHSMLLFDNLYKYDKKFKKNYDIASYMINNPNFKF